MKLRGVSKRFTDCMKAKLDKGCDSGHMGWETRWRVSRPDLKGVDGYLMRRLHAEVSELILAINEGNARHILKEAADVANFAMFIADVYLKDNPNA